MVKSYREYQRQLKIDRKLGRIPANARLNGTKASLEALINNVKVKRNVRIQQMLRKIDSSINKPRGQKVKMGKYISIRDVIKGIRKVDSTTHNPVLQYGDMWYPMTRSRSKQLLRELDQPYGEIYQNQVELSSNNKSDQEFEQLLTGKVLDEVRIRWVPKAVRRKEGAYFPYLHTTSLDLSRFQLFNEMDADNFTENCFIHALEMWDKLTKGEIQTIKYVCRNHFVIPQSSFKNIVTEIPDFGIIVKRIYIDTTHRTKVVKFNENASRVIELGLIEGHYFIIEPVECTSYAIKHYEEVKGKERWNEFIKKDERNSERFIDSFKLVKLLVEQKDTLLIRIKPCEELYNSAHYDIRQEITDLTYTERNVREIEYKDKTPTEDKEYSNIVYFDFETAPHDKHKELLICFGSRGSEMEYSFTGRNCAVKFLDSLEDNTLCMAQNLGYDVNFIIQHLYNIKTIQPTASRCISLSGTYYKFGKPIKLKFKCTYAMIDSSLRKFGEMFALEQEKEVMPYGLYTTENSLGKTKPVLISDALKHLPEDEHEQFLNNLDRWNCRRDNDTFDHIKYSTKYCKMDVKVTRLGYEKFRGWMNEITGLDIDNYLTIASVAYAYIVKEGCLDGCYQFSGNLQQFIQKCVVGGRTMMSENKKSFNIYCGKKFEKYSHKIVDFDGVSLYPSAMARMKGFIKGTPKILSDLSYEFLKKQDQYFVQVNITKVNKKRKFPLLNVMTDAGTRLYSNKLLGMHHVDKVGLEDLIKFQDVEFEIVRGYYFNEGFNTKIKETMLYLFNKRKEMKKVGNPIQAVYKLLMNSAYGKLCQKPIDVKRDILDKKTFDVRLRENFNHIKSVVEFPGGELFNVASVKPIHKHFNSCHQGAYVLSMSKRIMNEVMCLAEDLGIDMRYQDTDSIHMDASKTELLSDEFRKMYGRELIGKDLGQFHNDFDFKSERGKENIYADKSIFLGKKCYIDRVVLFKKKDDVVYKEGKVYPEEAYDKVYDYHVRMKSVPREIIDITSAQLGYEDIFDLYEHMYESNKVKFDLLLGSRPRFRSTRDYQIRTLTKGVVGDEFIRTLVF